MPENVIDGAVASRLTDTDALCVLPALSAAEQPKLCEPSVVAEPAAHVDDVPEVASATVQLTWTFDVYQPLRPAVPTTFGVIVGSVASRFTVTLLLALLPAASVAVQVNVSVPSVDRVLRAHADELPEVASEMDQSTVTADVYQPLVPAVPPTVSVITGAVASRLIVTELEAVPPADVAEQVNV